MAGFSQNRKGEGAIKRKEEAEDRRWRSRAHRRGAGCIPSCGIRSPVAGADDAGGRRRRSWGFFRRANGERPKKRDRWRGGAGTRGPGEAETLREKERAAKRRARARRRESRNPRGRGAPDGRYDGSFLTNYVNLYMKDELARATGVGEVHVFSTLDYSMRVWLDNDRLKALKLSTSDILNAIRSQNIQAAVGRIGSMPVKDEQLFQISLTTQGRFKTVKDFELQLKQAKAYYEIGKKAKIDVTTIKSGTYSSFSGINCVCEASLFSNLTNLTLMDLLRR